MVQTMNMSQPTNSSDQPDPPAQLPAVIPPGAVTVAADPVALVPVLIDAAGHAAKACVRWGPKNGAGPPEPEDDPSA
jgi:hypothetical protein